VTASSAGESLMFHGRLKDRPWPALEQRRIHGLSHNVFDRPESRHCRTVFYFPSALYCSPTFPFHDIAQTDCITGVELLPLSVDAISKTGILPDGHNASARIRETVTVESPVDFYA
jgi:hypothetical protein